MTTRGQASRAARRAAIAAIGAVAALTLVPATASHADSSSTVTVVGTSDVFDSDLIQQVIKPDFEAANPKYTLNYVSQGTGAAISYAEAGTASALLVHAASLENSFVNPGPGLTSFSLEQDGRAIFYGDYVLLGPASDPAGVMTGPNDPSHDIVSAFDKIQVAGTAGTANFVSRGGTPGTTVEEHAIWALDSADPNLCTVSPANGGGETPSTTTGNCPNPVVPPAWYHVTGLTQGPNVVNSDVCNYPTASGGNNCYVLTDRGTYQYLQSEGALNHMVVVANNNSATATGGANLLINSFHAYAVNPAAFTSNPNVHINTAGAEAFLNWLTSPAGQADVNAYQENVGSGRSFKMDATPDLSTRLSAASVTAGRTETISGTLSNVVPGAPPIAAEAMTLTALTAGSSTPTTVAQAATDAEGNYSFPSFTPSVTATYTVHTGTPSTADQQIVQVENSTLTPIYSDLLNPASASAGKVTVVPVVVPKPIGKPAITSLTAKKGVVTIKGTLSPKVVGTGATLKVYANIANFVSVEGLKLKATDSLANGATKFTAKITLKRGFTYKFDVKYLHAAVIKTGTSTTKSVHVS
jgi:tungstate transport system substrate-binding protein